MRIVIEEGGKIPFNPWYYPAWDEFRVNNKLACVICYPIGIHLIARAMRSLWHWYRWSVDRRVKSFTKYDELDHANNWIENLIIDNRSLRSQVETLKYIRRAEDNER